MWIYYNQFGNLTTKIPHGEVIRQGATFNLYIAVDKEYFKEDIVESTGRNFLSFTLQEIVDWINTEILATLKINDLSAIDVLRAEKKKFTKVKNSEIIFDFVNNQEYIVFNYTGNHSLLTKPGNYEAVFQLKNKNTDETKPLGLIQFHCEKTYGQNIPNEQITPDQYNYLLSAIGNKVSYTDYDIYDVGTFSDIKDIAHAILNHKNIKGGGFFYKAKLEDANMGFSKDAFAIAGYEKNQDSSFYRTIILCDNQITVYGGLDNEKIELLTIPQLLTRKLKVVESIDVPTPTNAANAVNKKYVDEQKEEVKNSIPTKNSQLENDSRYVTEKFFSENIIDISKSKLIEIIGIATTDNPGLMSIEDKQKLETIATLLSNEEDENNIVDKIAEVVKIFENYPETSNLIEFLSQKAEEIIDEKVGDVDAVLDEINGGGTLSGGTSSGGTSSEQEVEIEFSISASENQSTDYGEWILTPITPFTDWYKVKSAKFILKGTSEMATPSDIVASYPNVMGMFEQGTNNANVFYLCSMVVENGSPSYSTFIYTKQNGFKYQGTGNFRIMVEMYLALGVTTCTLIVTI